MNDHMPTAEMISLIRSQSMGVLAVISEGNPHCGLMAYITDETAGRLYFATLRNTAKYRAILKHPRISFLIDTRTQEPVERSRIQSLTLSGLCKPVEDPILGKAILEQLKATHGHLTELLTQPDVAVLAFDIHRFQLQKGPLEQVRVQLKEAVSPSRQESG